MGTAIPKLSVVVLTRATRLFSLHISALTFAVFTNSPDLLTTLIFGDNAFKPDVNALSKLTSTNIEGVILDLSKMLLVFFTSSEKEFLVKAKRLYSPCFSVSARKRWPSEKPLLISKISLKTTWFSALLLNSTNKEESRLEGSRLWAFKTVALNHKSSPNSKTDLLSWR